MFIAVVSIQTILAKAHELKKFFEDSKKVKELEQTILDLERQLKEADAKVLKLQNALIYEMEYSMRLKGKVEQYERNCDL